MNRVFLLTFFLLTVSCGEKLLVAPEDLIPRDEMILILKDFSILNSARATNAEILRNYNIEPTEFIFTKYGIDSLRFATSDNYYASLPEQYEGMYQEIEKLLDAEEERTSQTKRKKDSLDLLLNLKNNPIKKATPSRSKDSLP